MICNKVVLPAPLRPMIPILSPRRTLKLISRKHPVLMVELLPMPEDRLFELIVAPHIELERLADAIAANDNIR